MRQCASDFAWRYRLLWHGHHRQECGGNVGGNLGTPAEDTTNYMSILGGKSETLTFSGTQNRFGLFWGSIDSYNSIAFYSGRRC